MCHFTPRLPGVGLALLGLFSGVLSAQDPTSVERRRMQLPAQPFSASWEPQTQRVGPRDPSAEDRVGVWSGASQGSPRRPSPWAPSRFADSAPVGLWNGAVHLVEVDLSVQSRGIPFVWARTYTSNANFAGDLGFNWTHPYARRVVALGGGRYARVDGLGREDVFRAADGSVMVSPRGIFATLEWGAGGGLVETLPSGLRFSYSRADQDVIGGAAPATWSLDRIEDRCGNTVVVHRDGQGRVRHIVDTQGRSYWLSYVGGRIVKLADFAGREVVYGYDAAGDLVSCRTPVVTGTPNGNDFPSGKMTRYVYSQGHLGSPLAHNLVKKIEPRFFVDGNLAASPAIWEMTYASTRNPAAPDYDHVVRVRVGHDRGGPNREPNRAVGGTLELSYVQDFAGDPMAPPSAVRCAIVTTRAGDVRRHYFDANGQQVRRVELTNRNVRPGEGDYTTDWTYNPDGLMTARDLPRGNRVEFVYDSDNGNRRAQANLLEVRQRAGSVSSEPDIATLFLYEPIYQQVRTVTDPRGFPGGVVPRGQSGRVDIADPQVASYTTTWIYDYQEQRGVQAARAVPVPQRIPEALGDLNGAPDHAEGNVVQVRYPTIDTPGPNLGDTSVESRTWNAHGQPLDLVDATGVVTRHSYFQSNGRRGDPDDLEGYLAMRIDDAGGTEERTTRWERDTRGNATAILDPKSQRTDIAFNALDQVVCQTSPAVGGSARIRTYYWYDLNDDLVQVARENRDENGQLHTNAWIESRFDYDVLHRRWVEEHEASDDEADTGAFMEYILVWDPMERPVALVSPAPTEGAHARSMITTVRYDERGQVYKTISGDDDHDPANAPPAGAVVQTFNYDGNRNRTEFLDSVLQRRSTRSPQPTSAFPGSASGDLTLSEYGGFDRLLRATDAEGNTREYEYDAASNVIRIRAHGSVGGAAGAVTLLADIDLQVDNYDRVVRRIAGFWGGDGSPVGSGVSTTTYGYDLASRLISQTDPNANTTTYEWVGGRLKKVIDPLANELRFEIDPNGNVVKRTQYDVSTELGTQPEVRETTFVYDELDRLVRRTNPAGEESRWYWDSRGNVVETRDARGNRVLFDYDGLDRLTRAERLMTSTGRGGGTEIGRVVMEQVWESDSLLRSRTDGAGNRTDFEYDELGRTILVTHADGSSRTYSYDADGRLASWTDPNGTSATLTRDGLGRLVERRFARGPGVLGTTMEQFEYDGRRRLTRVESDDILTAQPWVVRFEYDSLSNCTLDQQGQTRVESAYDAARNRTELVYPGVSGGGSWTAYAAYDARNRLASLTGGPTGSTSTEQILRQFHKGWSRLEARTYGDTRSPVVQLDQTFDLAQRPVEVVYTGGWGAAAYQYGNESIYEMSFEKRPHHGDIGEVFVRDSLGEILAERRVDLSAVSPGQSILPETFPSNDSEEFVYDGAGSRISSTLISGGSATATSYGRGPLNEYQTMTTSSGTAVLEYDANGNLTRTGSAQYSFDAHNRLVEVRDPQGTVVAQYGYDGLGRRRQSVVGPRVTDFVFAGASVIEEGAGQTYFNGRFLDVEDFATEQVYHRTVDVSLNLRYTDPTDPTDPSADDPEHVFTHEIGHVLGLWHNHAGSGTARSRLHPIGLTLKRGTVNATRKIPGLHKTMDITLKRGVVGARSYGSYRRGNNNFVVGNTNGYPNSGGGHILYAGFTFRKAAQTPLPAQFVVNTHRIDPYKSFKFHIKWGGQVGALHGNFRLAESIFIEKQQASGEAVPAAQFTVNPHRLDPYKNFKFHIKWDGQVVAGAAGIHDGFVLINEVDGTPSIGNTDTIVARREAVDLPRARRDLVAINSGGSWLYPLADGRGNVTGIVDASGNLVEEMRYTAFGVESHTGAATGSEWKYLSVRRYFESGLYLLDGRDYDPVLGRFLQRDPADGSQNLRNGYSRAGNRGGAGR